MKKENVRKMTVLFLAMGLVGIGSAATQAAEPITITSDQGSEATSIESLCGKGILSKKMASDYTVYPTVGDEGNVVIIDFGDGSLKGTNIAAGKESHNSITIESGTFGSKNAQFEFQKAAIYGSYNGYNADYNRVDIKGGTFYQEVYGGAGFNSSSYNEVVVSGGIVYTVGGGWLRAGEIATKNIVRITNGSVGEAYGARSTANASHNQVYVTEQGKVNVIYGGYGTGTGTWKISENLVEITSNAKVSTNGRIYGGYSLSSGEVTSNIVQISGAESILKNTNVVGGYSSNGSANDNKVNIFGGEVSGTITGGQGATANNNTITLKSNADVSGANLYGSNLSADQTDGNTLIIDGWNSSSANGNAVKKVKNFDEITFRNLAWENGGIALNITGADTSGQLKDTKVNVENLTLDGDIGIKAGDKMTFIQSNADTGLSMEHVQLTEDALFSQGVATVGKLDVKLEGATNNLIGEIKSVSFNPQTDVIAENRTAAAAFLNQGADIAADSLDLLGSDYKYGLRTFGAVYGNRSTYDSAGDVKINGWSEIVGLGNVHRKGDGDLAWGVFYENGTGNYRTWNQFNNEMFRGDGSLRYNGGGAAVRYTRDSGWYYEASVRAGTLSASMENAVKDGEGNSYGFDNDSTYWGVHAGIGRLIDTERGEWNLYGKYFHTDIEGSSFSIVKDRFVFDSLDSDRLRLGARYTADKTKRWSLYYGLAWEYEFSGDSHMRAAQWNAPEQSLGGSTGIAEIGTVWQPDDSPWQADINIKGYTGEREGFSGMVQLAYTF